MKKSPARFLCVILAIALLLTALPITVYAEGGVVKTASTAEQLTAICNEINANGGTYTIELTADIEGGCIGIDHPNADVTVIADGADRTIFNNTTAVYADKGAKVTIGGGQYGLTLKANDVVTTDPGEAVDYPGLIHVLSGSTCVMNDKVTLKDRKSNNYLGGGVTINGGTFIMNGGTIENCGIDGGSVCYGGGVAVFNGGYFEMNGGTISNCYAFSDYIDDFDPNRCFTAQGGGVYVADGSSFTMNGGTISNCKATNFGGGVALDITYAEIEEANKQFGYLKSNVTINGGTITGNQADCGGGVFSSGYFYSYASVFYGYIAAGSVPPTPGLFINGGEISSNTAADMGGGVCVAMFRDTVKCQIHNAKIKNNTADNGAGIENFGYWTQMDIDGCTITGNKAVSNGGGIFLSNNTSGGLTNLKNTTVTGNTSGDRGAGVCYDANSKLNISGADVIQNNTYNGKLNNLNVLSLEKPVYVVGDLTGSQIGLSDPTLWDDGKEDYDAAAVSTEYLTSGYKDYNPDVHPNEYFTSDHESWIVDRSVKTTTTEPDPNSNTYREYSVNRYPLADGVTPKGYAGNKGQYIILKTESDTSGITNSDTLFTALKDYYNDSTYYDLNQNFNYDSEVRFLPHDTNAPLSYIQLKKNNSGQITVTYYPSRDKRQYSGFVACSASVSIQNNYANSGELVLQITSDGSSYFNNAQFFGFTFSENSTPYTINYVDANPPGDILYEYDEYGDVTAKLEIVSCETKTKQIEVESGTDDEVRLVRADINYHINNAEIAANYPGTDDSERDIFTDEVEAEIGEVKVGDKIESFYLIPEAKTSSTNSCPYIFKGWYYDKNNENDSRPVVFGTDHYSKDIYAHWITVSDVDKDENDKNDLPPGYTKYGGFDLAGVQIRKEMRDYNFDPIPKMPGGMRFITSLSMDVVRQVNALKAGGNNIEYGYVAATNKDWIEYHKKTDGRKLLYVSDSEPHPNGIDTASNDATNENYFGFAKNVDCTSRLANKNGVVPLDHQNYNGYLLYSLVITYEGDNADYGKDVLARPYIKYTDANGLVRVAYSDYRGTNVIGGCYTNYNAIPTN